MMIDFSPLPLSTMTQDFAVDTIQRVKKRRSRVSIDVKTVKAQGPRNTMEDCYCVEDIGNGRVVLAVFDGHGGVDVARMCAEETPALLKAIVKTNPDMSECLRLLYKSLDDKAKDMDQEVGCTAAIAVVTPDRVWFSNCGDAMIALKVRNKDVEFVSEDHKVENEIDRIQELGGLVTHLGGCARIYGTLNIARSIGDHFLKNFVWSDPYVTATSCLKSEIDWIVVASDGLWDVFTPEQLQSSLERRDHNLGLLLQECYHRGSSDNVTIVHARFTPLPP